MKFRLAMGLALAGLLPLAAGAAGTVVKLEGSALVERQGRNLPASEAFPIQAGDKLRVTSDSKAQVHFDDDSLFAIPGVAVLAVDEFQMPASGKAGAAVYTLEAGGLRTVTGTIQGSAGRYEMRTPQATITVQGSAYSALICAKQCGRKYRSGLYVRSESGVIAVANGAGRTALRTGQVVFVESSTAAPVAVKDSPFNDPQFASDFAIGVQFDTEVHPPRIEPEPAASPS